MSNLLTEATILNNEGVALLLEGKPQEAIHIFKRGLALMDQNLSMPNPHQSGSSWGQPNNSSLTDLCVISSAPFLGSWEENEYHLFDSAIALIETENSQENVAFYTAASMVNMALAFTNSPNTTNST